MNERYVGLMSGTSLDGVDAVLIEWTGLENSPLRVLAHVHRPFEPALATELLALNASGADELHRASIAGNGLARLYAAAVCQLLDDTGVGAAEVRAIGVHGQTVRHRPQQFDGLGYTLQLNNPSLLAELTGIDVVADLRSRDLAAGGQGAPLVPAFHHALFARAGEALAVLNLGGIANLTLIGADGSVSGFDCGPANALLDHWVKRHRGEAFDAEGRWAASGRVDAALLTALQSEPYFQQPPPKSTGRDLFHPPWLDRHLSARGAIAGADVQATLAELTAWSCTRDLQRHLPDARTLLVCGGGAFNAHLMQRLSERLPGVHVASTAERGLPADQVEACAFAWLARAFVHREPASLPAVTGARGSRVLGALYPR